MRRSCSNLSYFRFVIFQKCGIFVRLNFIILFLAGAGGGGEGANLQSMGKSTILLNPIFKPLG